ncbi:hypothetical protein HMPREF9103_03148 [Lentilactobacillus parafarraginis F0439]|uniref:Uncharacterized protein n=2 Tax=Lentilactobacillus parafarraginis TaxID=390842 RepID=G9ZTR3_9LACO|nr:hypothetical protein HMPREF9103_03148 [Lentilactobacillus parafarraginis F0439]
MIFMTLSLIQTLIVTLSTMFILPIHAESPLLLLLTGGIISIGFMIIIYTLVCLFGNLGKALRSGVTRDPACGQWGDLSDSIESAGVPINSTPISICIWGEWLSRGNWRTKYWNGCDKLLRSGCHGGGNVVAGTFNETAA